jgi:hypothetical protein
MVYTCRHRRHVGVPLNKKFLLASYGHHVLVILLLGGAVASQVCSVSYYLAGYLW